MSRIILIILVLFFSQSFGLEGMRCGTSRFAENLKNPKKKMLAKAGCIPENLYEVIDTKKTQNFIIYYTKTKAHAIRSNEYIDSIASYLEQAYNLHKNTLGMKSISGARKTYQYLQNVPSGLYPVEVIDTGLLRGWECESVGYDKCYAQTFGLTFPPDDRKYKETEVIIENDFAYGADCSGNLSKFHFRSKGVDYYEEWKLILKATVFHELYHAFQFPYYVGNSFWMEASATGVEEIGVPDANDYINYLSNVPGKSMEDADEMEEYGWATLYLFLYSQIDKRFDSAIWNYFSKYPSDKFGIQLARLVDSLQKKQGFKKNAEDLFHEYATRIFYSGSRAEFSLDEFFWEDMPNWPTWNVYKTTPPTALQIGTFDFIRTENEPSTAFARKSSLRDGNSMVWVLSRLLENENIQFEDPKNPDDPNDTLVTVKKFVAYPNPWNTRDTLRFINLPEKSKGVEIRSANGALIARVDSLWKPEKIPAPGILYYRDLPYGKNKVLIVQY